MSKDYVDFISDIIAGNNKEVDEVTKNGKPQDTREIPKQKTH